MLLARHVTALEKIQADVKQERDVAQHHSHGEISVPVREKYHILRPGLFLYWSHSLGREGCITDE